MIQIGVLATLEGPYRVLGEDAERGTTLALSDSGGQVGGQSVELSFESTNAMPVSATQACERLLKNGVDVIVGPLSGDEGNAVREFARQHPEITFVNGVAGSQGIYDPAPNFFSFSPNGVQYIAGLGAYAYETGYRRVVTLAEGYSYPYAQIGGFSLEYCNAGGEIVEMLWCGLGTKDFSQYIDKIPDDVDAVCSVLGGDDSVRFIEQYRERGKTMPIIGGTLQGDPTSLHFLRDSGDLLVGMLTASPISDELPDASWQAFADAYRKQYPDGFYSPSIVAFGYYMNMKAILLALDGISADLSDGQAKLKDALTGLEFDGLTCGVKLDRHRFPVIDNFVNEIAVKPDGTVYTRMLKRIEGVDSTLGYTDEDWLALGEFNIRNMPCGRFSDRSKRESFEDILKRRRGE